MRVDHLQLLRPECRIFIREGLEQELYAAIERLVAVYGSSQIAVDERHTPKLYSDFLGRLLAKHKRELEQARIAEQLKSSKKQTSGGMTAHVDENGKLVWQ